MTCLLIDDGGLGALAAASIRPDPTRVIVWHPVRTDGARVAAEGHAEVLMASFVAVDDLPARDDDLDDAAVLLSACRAAIAREVELVVWPVHAGADPSRALRAAELAAGIGDLVAAAGHEIEVALPILECEDDQVVDLVDDAGLPLGSFFSCDGSCDGAAPAPCGTCPRCRRWQRAFRARSIAWPWDPAPRPVDVTG